MCDFYFEARRPEVWVWCRVRAESSNTSKRSVSHVTSPGFDNRLHIISMSSDPGDWTPYQWLLAGRAFVLSWSSPFSSSLHFYNFLFCLLLCGVVFFFNFRGAELKPAYSKPLISFLTFSPISDWSLKHHEHLSSCGWRVTSGGDRYPTHEDLVVQILCWYVDSDLK